MEEVSHEMLVLALPSHKMEGRFRVLRDRRNTLETRQCKCVVFSWQAQHLVSVLESGGSFAKVILVELCKKGFMEFEGSLARNARFGASNFQGERSFSHFAWQAQDFGSFLLEKLKKPCTKCSFWKLVALKVEVLEASVVLCSTA